MKKLLILPLFLFGCTKDSSPVCEISKIVADTVGKEVAVQLDCKKPQAVVDSLFKQLEEWKVCSPTQQGPIGEIICPRIVDSVVSGAFKQIPAAWECSGGALKDQAKQQLLDMCKKAI